MAGSLFDTSGKLTAVFAMLAPKNSTIEKELQLFSHLCFSSAARAYLGGFLNKKATPYSSWHQNQFFLSQIPVFTEEDGRLVHFLQQRWLAKVTGYFPFALQWVYPCYGVEVQANVNTNFSYSRLPANNMSRPYLNRIASLKKQLNITSPLILTRPVDVCPYLPSHVVEASSGKEGKDLIYIEKFVHDGVGAIRIVPQVGQTSQQIDQQYKDLLGWVSNFGLAANRIELDRWPATADFTKNESSSHPILLKEDCLKFLHLFEGEWKRGESHKDLMVDGFLQVMQGLFSHVSQEKWEAVFHLQTKAAIVSVSLQKIQEHLSALHDLSFFDFSSQLEQIYAHFSALLEIFGTFSDDDFSNIYRQVLSFPSDLGSYGIHTSGMTSLAGILKAVEKTVGSKPSIIYGENSYYECIHVIKQAASSAICADQAQAEDWQKADLIFAQFSPAMQTDLDHQYYREEKIADFLKNALQNREKPLTLAIDCTLDAICSPRVAKLLEECRPHIENGSLNWIAYRSGNKFDLFGMDNYCGSPIVLFHNREAKWDHFEAMLTDPALSCDRLSLNWFCLAYRYASGPLHDYQKQIFANTRALFKKIPASLFAKQKYQVIAVDDHVDPSFITIKVTGPLHAYRASGLVGGAFFVKAFEAGYPIFTRPSLGYYHPNYTIIFSNDCTIARITLGLDPSQVDAVASIFEIISQLN
jgi:hypothetical protein